jgi:sterol desaturase/sphingolipid hydroxylase (fatty acid hydroxylase superfamily)
MLNPILLAVPFFLILMIIEWTWAKRIKKDVYILPDSLTNLQLGTGQILIATLIKPPQLAIYALIYQMSITSFPILTWDLSSPWSWIGGFILVDFAYYLFHWMSHRVNFMWAAHAVHHQSESYNLSVALRQSWLQQVYSGFFYLPLALTGLPVGAFFLMSSLNTLYQFWIHTQLINRMGPLEWIINTPAHHRVHHGVDDPYIDRNYAGVFIIWDRLFNTFIDEEFSPRYGVVKPLRSWNPGRANLEVWVWMKYRWTAAQSFLSSSSFQHRIRANISFIWCLMWKGPEWKDEQEEYALPLLRTDEMYQLYHKKSHWFIYALVIGFLNIQTALIVIGYSTSISTLTLSLWVIFHLWAGISLSGLLESQKWGEISEIVRLIYGFVIITYSPFSTYFFHWTTLILGGIGLLSLIWFLTHMIWIQPRLKLSHKAES